MSIELQQPSASADFNTHANRAAVLKPRTKGWRWALALGIGVIVSAASLVAWNNGLKDQFYPRAFRPVDDGQVYASGQISRRLIRRTLTQYHIRRIVSLSLDEPNDPDELAEQKVAAELGVSQVVYPLNGNGTGDIHNYEKTLEEVVRAERAHEPLLVHCYSGAQRSGGWIAFYRLLIQKRPPDEVAAELHRSRWEDGRNPKLVAYVNEHMGEMAKLLVARGLIDHVPDPLPRLNP